LSDSIVNISFVANLNILFSNNVIILKSSSPDEVALLQGAEQMGFEFTKRTSETIELKTFSGSYQIWELVIELPFDSTRKRMSVIVKQKSGKDSNYYLFTKGADTAMLPNMNLNEKNIELIKGMF